MQALREGAAPSPREACLLASSRLTASNGTCGQLSKSRTLKDSQLSSNLGEFKVNLWDYKGSILPQKG